jgi:hypothetical protein
LLNAAKIKAVAQTGWFKWTVNIAFSALFVYWLISYDIVDALSAVAVADLTLHTLAAGLVLILMQFLRSWRLVPRSLQSTRTAYRCTTTSSPC